MTLYTVTEQAKSLDCLIRLLHEVMGRATATILTIVFCELKYFPL